ncbi:MAG: hypothetical protein IPK80_01365 [Nannocystis sp.]|nr:hypothetical protein [Nannocystis sp.]
MYIDPSRVDMLARYSARLAAATPEQLSALEGEVRLFIATLWTEATPEARSRFLDAVRRVGPPMPWSAVVARPGGPPAAVELILGQVDPDDEGVPSYRLDPKSEQGERALEALAAWDPQTTLQALGATGGSNQPQDPATDPVGEPAPNTTALDTAPSSNTNSPTLSRGAIATLAVIGWGTAAAAMTVRSRS